MTRPSADATRSSYDVIIVGAGPNGLSAANALADAGVSTLLVEGKDRVGGGCRTSELTLPGYLHDDCAAVHPLGVGSPYLRTLGLERFGLEWREPEAPLVHLMADGSAVTLEHSVNDTAAQLGPDGSAYRRLLRPIVERFPELAEMFLGPLRFPRWPVPYARFGLQAVSSMEGLNRRWFRGKRAGALLGGIAAHAMVPLDAPASCAFALVLAAAGHAYGWPIARGGSQSIVQALARRYQAAGGDIVVNRYVHSLRELPKARAYVLDVTPQQLLRMASNDLPKGYRQRLERFRYGPGVYKMDWAMSRPIPWHDRAVARAATVHLSGSLEDVSAAARGVYEKRRVEHPFTLLAQPTLFDEARAPSGAHTAWAYCHVPHGSAVDVSRDIENHIERFAPGFKASVLARSTRSALDMERYNANYVGGDINGGAAIFSQLFFRPVARIDPYRTPAPHIFLCSSSTPPGGGVHGMCGYWAARSVLSYLEKQ